MKPWGGKGGEALGAAISQEQPLDLLVVVLESNSSKTVLFKLQVKPHHIFAHSLSYSANNPTGQAKQTLRQVPVLATPPSVSFDPRRFIRNLTSQLVYLA